MNIENFDNELSSDDEDYCPDKAPESASENSGPDDDDLEGSDNEVSSKKTKKAKKPAKCRKGRSAIVEEKEKEYVPVTSTVDPEEEKRREDALWAEFLGETETPVEAPKKIVTAPASSSSSTATSSSKPNIPATKPPVERKVFEFAGETVEIATKTPVAQEKPAAATPSPKFTGIKRSGGISSALDQLTKKNKLSVLEKTKLDWDGFKSNEGIVEELQTHNRGREG